MAFSDKGPKPHPDAHWSTLANSWILPDEVIRQQSRDAELKAQLEQQRLVKEAAEALSAYNWDRYFIEMAMMVAKKSKDPSTKVGCVLVGPENQVLSTGFNGFARGVNELDPKRWERPTKYQLVVHAEANAVFNAARHGIPLRGARAYLNWEPVPCSDCAKALMQSGIVEVVGPAIPFVGKGSGVDYHLNVTGLMFEEGKIIQRRVPWKT